MSQRLSLGFKDLEDEVHQPAQVIQRSRLEKALAIRLINELGVPVIRDLDEAQDLVVAQPHNGIVDPTLIETQPVVVRFAVWPHPKPVAIDTDAGPFLQPASDFHPWTDACDCVGFQIEGKETSSHGTTVEVAVPIPQVLDGWPRAIEGDLDGPVTVEHRVDAVRRALENVGPEL